MVHPPAQNREGAGIEAQPRLGANAYGGFVPGSGAFEIFDPQTPKPWINVLANEVYGLVLSQVGGGFSWYKNCQLFRINRWEQDLVRDEYGRFLYLYELDRDSGVWSTTFQPTRRGADFDRIVHQPGCTTFERRFNGLETIHSVFVPPDMVGEVWNIRVRNLENSPRRFRLAVATELHLGGAGDAHREFHRLFMESKVIEGALVAWKHLGLAEGVREPSGSTARVAFRVHGVDKVDWVTDKTQWLGRNGTWATPAGLLNPTVADESQRWDEPVAAGVFEIDVAAMAETQIVVTIGVGETDEAALAQASRWSGERAESEQQATIEAWRARIGGLDLDSGEPEIDLLCNVWLGYQAIAGRMLARCAYYQQGGAYGYRDQLQDSLMLLSGRPEECLAQLERNAEAMHPSGQVRHWWHPGTEISVPSHHSDTSCWLAYGLLAYLDETADLASLGRRLSYFGSNERGDLFQHAVRGIERALDRRSHRGLPLIGGGDWNDGLSHVGIDGHGESIWLAMFLYDILTRWKPYLEEAGHDALADRWATAAENLRSAVETFGWDGDWYLAATRDDGLPLGSKACTEGKFFLNPQTWATISGIGSADRKRAALAAVKRDLLTPYGALLLRPAYSKVDPHVGYISRYAPGLRENGGIYSHASNWAIQAFAMSGDPDTAIQIARGMCPALRAEENVELYAAEPYVMPGNVDGPDSPYYGRAGWTWYTGSAAWFRRVYVECICGVRATRKGLRVEPCLPMGHRGVRLRREFRGDTYDLEIYPGGRALLAGPGDGSTISVRVEPSKETEQ